LRTPATGFCAKENPDQSEKSAVKRTADNLYKTNFRPYSLSPFNIKKSFNNFELL